MTKLRIVDGELELKSVEELTTEELEIWIEKRLKGRDTDTPTDMRQGERPYQLLADIYPELSRLVRQDIDRFVQRAVEDMADNLQTPWHGIATHELLLLAQDIEVDNLTDILENLAETQKFFRNEEIERADDLHFRVLQTLIAFGWPGNTDFWQNQARLSPDRYGGLAFSALSRLDLEKSLELLTELPESENLTDAALTALPSILARHGNDVALPLLWQYLPKMPQYREATLIDFLHELGHPCPQSEEQQNLEQVFEALRKRDIPLIHTTPGLE